MNPFQKELNRLNPFAQATLQPLSYASLGKGFFVPVSPTPFKATPYLIHYNEPLAAQLSLSVTDEKALADITQILSGQAALGEIESLATVYCGHQFGSFVPQLGDGRALLIGQVQAQTTHDNPTGQYELQLKGAGPTPFSRRADGRAVLRSSIREYLCAEAMHGLGIPTTRSLCLTGAMDPVFRETKETASVVTRVAPSFVRFGHFEYFASTKQYEHLQQLADYVIDRYYPKAREQTRPVWALLEAVVQRTAQMIAAWQAVGFCHGVMNTDNMSILGLTIDYGPFGFLDSFKADHICNHSDHSGRYAYNQQPGIGHWNLYALAQGLQPLLGDDVAAIRQVLDQYTPQFEAEYSRRMGAKLGFAHATPDDLNFIADTLQLLDKHHIDFTRFFRGLSTLGDTLTLSLGHHHPDAPVRDLFIDRPAFDAWAVAWRERLGQQGLDPSTRSQLQNQHNPNIVLRNHMAQQAIDQANHGDFSEVERLFKALAHPYEDRPEHALYLGLPPDWAGSLEVSCSS